MNGNDTSSNRYQHPDYAQRAQSAAASEFPERYYSGLPAACHWCGRVAPVTPIDLDNICARCVAIGDKERAQLGMSEAEKDQAKWGKRKEAPPQCPPLVSVEFGEAMTNLARLFDAEREHAAGLVEMNQECIKDRDQARHVAGRWKDAFMDSDKKRRGHSGDLNRTKERLKSALTLLAHWMQGSRPVNATHAFVQAVQAEPQTAEGILDEQQKRTEQLHKSFTMQQQAQPTEEQAKLQQLAGMTADPVRLESRLAEGKSALPDEETEAFLSATPTQAAEPEPVSKADQDRSVPRAEIERAIARGIRDSRIVAGDPVLPEHPDTIALRECRAELEKMEQAYEAAAQDAYTLRDERNSNPMQDHPDLLSPKQELLNEQASHQRTHDMLHKRLESARAERDTALDALAEIHKVTGRGDGHGSPKDTAACVIDNVLSRSCDAGELQQELKELGDTWLERFTAESDAHDKTEAELSTALARIARAVAELEKVDMPSLADLAPHEARRITRAREALQ